MSTEFKENDFLKKSKAIADARIFLENLPYEIESLLLAIDEEQSNAFAKKHLLDLAIKRVTNQLEEIDPFLNREKIY